MKEIVQINVLVEYSKHYSQTILTTEGWTTEQLITNDNFTQTFSYASGTAQNQSVFKGKKYSDPHASELPSC